jgi:PIN domain nuclease of toxin-antitoxin system
VTHLDTHALVWFLTGHSELLRPVARRLRGPLGLSPMVFLEIEYLHAAGKLDLTGAQARRDVAGLHQFTVSAAPLLSVVERALALGWTRDPFDRLIAANALADGAALLTRDRQMLEHCPAAVWG